MRVHGFQSRRGLRFLLFLSLVTCVVMRVVWQAGGYATASALYKESLQVLRESDTSLEDVARKTEMVVMFL